MTAWTTLIDTETLAAHLDDARWVILDARFALTDTGLGAKRYAESHLPGAVYAHLDEDFSSPIIPGVTGRHPLPDRAALLERLRDWGINDDSQVVVYDDGPGAIASRAWWLLKWLGHDAVAVLDGGLAAWRVARHAETANVPAPARGAVTDRAPLVDVVDIDTVAANERRDVLLVDAREEERFTGEREPIDPVAGHIAGAVNCPFWDNLGDDGRFLPADALRARLAPLQAQADGEQRRLVHYCGSGVTAAHNVLATAHAGLPMPALYAGSFSEWITRDGERFPVASQAD